jgi:hypothetical protein
VFPQNLGLCGRYRNHADHETNQLLARKVFSAVDLDSEISFEVEHSTGKGSGSCEVRVEQASWWCGYSGRNHLSARGCVPIAIGDKGEPALGLLPHSATILMTQYLIRKEVRRWSWGRVQTRAAPVGRGLSVRGRGLRMRHAHVAGMMRGRGFGRRRANLNPKR